MPVVISFTLGADCRLPSGESSQEATEPTDAETGAAAAYYMINCVHPAHFRHALQRGEGWLNRVRGVRANAYRRSHAELDASTDFDDAHPHELAMSYAEPRAVLLQLSVVGGSRGTDERHVNEICRAMPLPAANWQQS